ncbi:MAG: hypothetical protein AAF191_14685, partial [Verrucomicrobiota bacterium]
MKKALLLLALSCLLSWSHAVPEILEIHAGNVSELPGGREADGIIGDFVMRNDVVEAVISCNAPMRKANMGTFWGAGGATPGCLYDLTFRGEDNDQLTIFSPAKLRGEVSWVRAVSKAGAKVAVVEVVRTSSKGRGISVRHLYQMNDGEPGLWITTELVNESDTKREVPMRDECSKFYRFGQIMGYHWAESVDPADRVGYAWKHAKGSVVPPSGKVT